MVVPRNTFVTCSTFIYIGYWTLNKYYYYYYNVYMLNRSLRSTVFTSLVPYRNRSIRLGKRLFGTSATKYPDFFKLYKPRRSLRSESNISLIPVHGRSIQINKRLLNCGVSTTWNSLPKDLRIIKSFILFKKHLKSYLNNL